MISEEQASQANNYANVVPASNLIVVVALSSSKSDSSPSVNSTSFSGCSISPSDSSSSGSDKSSDSSSSSSNSGSPPPSFQSSIDATTSCGSQIMEGHTSRANTDAPVSNSIVVAALPSPNSDSRSYDSFSSPSASSSSPSASSSSPSVSSSSPSASSSSPSDSFSSPSASSSSPSDKSRDPSLSSSDSSSPPLSFQASVDAATSGGSQIREEQASRANNDANTVPVSNSVVVAALSSPNYDSSLDSSSLSDKFIELVAHSASNLGIAALSSLEYEPSSPDSSTPPFELPPSIEYLESSSSSTESNPSPPFSQATVDAAPNSSRSRIRESSPSDNVRVKRLRADFSTASIHAPEGNLSLDVAQSSIEAPMSLATNAPGTSRDVSSACFRIPTPPGESSPAPERTNASREIRRQVSLDSRPTWRSLIPESGETAGSDARSEATSIQPSRGGKIKITRKEPDLIRHALDTLEALLKDLSYTNEPPGRLPVCIRTPAETDPGHPEPEQPRSDGELSPSICIPVGGPQEINHLRPIDSPKTEIPLSVPEATTTENCSNSREGSCLAETRAGIDPQNSPERNTGSSQPESNDPKSSGVPGSSSGKKISDSIPYPYQAGNERNRGLPSMDLSAEGIESTLESVGSHISFFASVLINEHVDRLNHSRGNFEIFRLAYETFKEHEYVKVVKLLHVARSILDMHGVTDGRDLFTKLSDNDHFLNQLNYAYFLIQMHHQYRPKIKETAKRIQALENTVRSIQEWKKPRLYDSSDPELN